jgi:hypothetical protein
MDDARTLSIKPGNEVRMMEGEPGGNGRRVVARRGVSRDPDWLVDQQERLVLIEDGQLGPRSAAERWTVVRQLD